MRLVLLALVLLAGCSSAGTSSQGNTSTPVASASACESEYRADADVTVFGVRVEGAGDFVAAAPGPDWRFTCVREGDAILRGEQQGAQRSVGIQRDEPPADEMPVTEYLARFMDAATDRLVAGGFTIDQRMGPRALDEDTVGLALQVSHEGRRGVQFVVMRAIRTPIGLLRYTVIEWGDDPARIEGVFDVLVHASRVFAAVTPEGP